MGITYNLITQEELIQICRKYVDEEQQDGIDYVQLLNVAKETKEEYIISLPNQKLKINKITGEATSSINNNALEVTQ